jgi:hypothetical protein
MPRTLVALLLAALAPAAPVPKVKKGLVYPYAVGTTWEYIHDGDEKMVWVERVAEVTEKDGVVTFKVDITPATGGTEFEVYRLKDGELGIIDTHFGEYDPAMPFARLGMKDGDEWEAEFTLTGDGRKSTRKWKYTVGQAEEITTPAGKFTATPVTRVEGPRRTSVFWFADGVGMIRQTVNGQKEPAQELKAFTPGKK